MAPKSPLPLPEEWNNVEEYVDSLLEFATSSDLFQNLCGGVHILDFITREPDLYSSLLPEEWRDWFDRFDIADILHLLLREDVKHFDRGDISEWKGGPLPPASLIGYIQNIRKHTLNRDFHPRPSSTNGRAHKIPTRIAVGMNVKKVHEVENFARFVDRLCSDFDSDEEEGSRCRPDIVDFGSGQNYLGRTLSSSPYDRHVFAIERKHENIFGAKGMDVSANLAPNKDKVMRNKKEYVRLKNEVGEEAAAAIMAMRQDKIDAMVPKRVDDSLESLTIQEQDSRGSITYVEHEIDDGNLQFLLDHKSPDPADIDASTHAANNRSIVVSLHSCGNLSNHGIRSLILNPSVAAVAIVGCCYNLLTERLGPATYKLPVLRPYHPRLEETSNAYDPHGFPMSSRLESYPHQSGIGVRLNITARMMAVQAPYNWGPEESEAFFTRHFYRALLQRIFLDYAVVTKPSDNYKVIVGSGPAGTNVPGPPLVIGSLRKACFSSFKAYVKGAQEKTADNPTYGPLIRDRMTTAGLTDQEIDDYEQRYRDHKKRLSVTWSLMAFSAGAVESIIVVDRWLYLREQECVRRCWVEPVFDYRFSPRNLAVVGVKK